MATNVEPAAVTQNVNCSICLNHFVEPKLLACSHTFCLACLANLFEAQQWIRNQISCPQCRMVTDVQDGDVSTLKTNDQLKSMVGAIKNAQRAGKEICGVCNSDDNSLAETYCKECEEYMCASCHQAHDKWKKNSGHQVITVTDVKSRKSVKKRRKCMTHRNEEEAFFCTDCRTYVCFRCRVLEHDKAGHHVVDKKEHENDYKKSVVYLQRRAEWIKLLIDKYINVVSEQRKKTKTIFEQRTKEVNEAYEESVQQLQQERDKLLNEYKEHGQKLENKFQSLEDGARKQITSVTRACELVGTGMKTAPVGQALIVHYTLCQELERILDNTCKPDCSLPKEVTGCADELKFKRRDDVLELGSIEKPG